jgi:hypothetical protein
MPTSLRSCSPLPQVPSIGYHIWKAVTHPGLSGVLRRFEAALLYPRSHPWDIISGGLLPIQAYLGYYVASKLLSSTPGLIHGISYREGRYPSRVLRRFETYPLIRYQWGTFTHDAAKDGAPIDQTDRRHDVIFFSVDVASREYSAGL